MAFLKVARKSNQRPTPIVGRWSFYLVETSISVSFLSPLLRLFPWVPRARRRQPVRFAARLTTGLLPERERIFLFGGVWQTSVPERCGEPQPAEMPPGSCIPTPWLDPYPPASAHVDPLASFPDRGIAPLDRRPLGFCRFHLSRCDAKQRASSRSKGKDSRKCYPWRNSRIWCKSRLQRGHGVVSGLMHRVRGLRRAD